jgi:hypothetical protein
MTASQAISWVQSELSLVEVAVVTKIAVIEKAESRFCSGFQQHIHAMPDEITNPEGKGHKFQSNAQHLYESTCFKFVSQDFLDGGGV